MTSNDTSTVSVRPLQERDREEWAELFRGYRDFYRLPSDEAVVDRVWGWLRDDAMDLDAFVAEADGRLAGFAHWRPFLRPATGTLGIYLDDLFAAEATRGRGVGRALIAAVDGIAVARGASVVRWITAKDNSRARRLYDAVATGTEWVTYDLTPGALARAEQDGDRT